MGLVWRFVLREPYIAVYAVCAVLQRKRANVIVKLAYSAYYLQGKGAELLAYFQILTLVSVEPRLVVVFVKLLEKRYYLFHDATVMFV